MSVFVDAFKLLVQERLQAYDSTIDVTSGSPADTLIVQPLLNRLGTDPFEIDIKTFLIKRGQEVFPDIDLITYDDLLINPISVFLEPLKQQINQIKLAQSVSNASSINSEEIQDLMSNWFVSPEEGKYSSGVARVYFPAPQACNISTTDSVISTDNLVFNPSSNYTFTVSDMLFNREGVLYYVDITVTASATGSKYNIEADTLSYTDIIGSVGVKNLVTFRGGEDGQTNQQFIESVQTGLSERSLLTDRGIKANITDVKSITTVGAGDPAMMRDIVRGSGEGLLYIVSTGVAFSSWIFLTGTNFVLPNQSIAVGDLIKVQFSVKTEPSNVYITNILWQDSVNALIEIDKNILNGSCTLLLYKPGVLTLDETPDGSTGSIPDNTVHVYGHTDIFVRPLADESTSLTIDSCSDTDNTQYFNLLKMTTATNLIEWDDTETYNIEIGDLLVVESGANAGSYEVIQTAPDVRVHKLFIATETGIRGRVIKKIKINLNNPKTQKYPLKDAAKDLVTFAGSELVQTGINLTSFNVVVGDSFEIIDGRDAGIYTITAFDPMLQGRGPVLSKQMKYTANGLNFKIYSTGTPIELPVITVNEVAILDTDKQETGITIPYLKPVNIVNTCCIEQGENYTVDADTLMILPDLANIWPPMEVTATPGNGIDARYTQLIEPADGTIRCIGADGANPISLVEVVMPPFLWNGLNNKFIVYVNEKDLKATNDVSNNQQTSPMARAKKNDCLVIRKGPAQGSYLIKDVRILELWAKNGAGHQNIALVEVFDEIKSNPIKSITSFIDYVNTIGASVPVLTSEDYFRIFDYATDYMSTDGFIELLSSRLTSALNYINFNINISATRTLIKNMLLSSYIVGQAPKTTLRNYFLSPTDITYYSDRTPTKFIIDNIIARPTELKTSIYPSTNVGIEELPRDGYMPSSASNYFSASSGSLIKHGVKTGDVLEFYPAVNELLGRKDMQSSFVCITKAGSDIVRLIYPDKTNNSNYIYNKHALQPGQLFFIESGPDIGSYYITEVISDTFPVHTIRINKKLIHTTLNYPIGWDDANMVRSTCINNSKIIQVNGATLLGAAAVDSYVSILSADSGSILTAGVDTSYVGTYKITAVDTNTNRVTIERSVNFSGTANAYIIFHASPNNLPTDTIGGGKSLSNQYVRFRIYSSNYELRDITINWNQSPNPLDDSSTQQLFLSTVLANPNFNHKVPYRITRKDVLKIKATDMANNRDEQGLYYFDIDAFVLTLDTSYTNNKTFKLNGRFNGGGYSLETRNKNYSYSVREGLDLIVHPTARLPNKVELDKMALYEKSLKIKYVTSSKIQDIQLFVDSASNRVLASNTLVRHYIPAQLMLTIAYTGGSDSTVLSQDIIDYVNNIGSVNKVLTAEQILKLFLKRGATYIKQPLILQAIVHGLDRQLQLITSNSSLGTDLPLFNGYNTQVYWLPGKDISLDIVRPDGCGIKLIKN